MTEALLPRAENGRGWEERERATSAALAAYQAARAEDTAALVAEVRAYAQAHYEAGGWDVVVECWTDEDIAGALLRYGYSDGQPYPVTTLDEAVTDSILAQVVSVWADREADARNSAF
jgi:hypothetical protein